MDGGRVKYKSWYVSTVGIIFYVNEVHLEKRCTAFSDLYCLWPTYLHAIDAAIYQIRQ